MRPTNKARSRYVRVLMWQAYTPVIPPPQVYIPEGIIQPEAWTPTFLQGGMLS